MRLKLTTTHYFTLYFFLLMGLYHYKIKTYFYWEYIAELKDGVFDFSLSRFLIAMLLFAVDLYFLMKVRKTRMSFIVISLFFILLTVPSLIAFTSAGMYPFKLMLYHQLFFFSLYGLSKVQINFKSVPVIKKSQALYLLVGITTLGIIPYLLVYGPYINLKNLLLIDVYQTRSTMGALSNPYFGYTYSLFTKIIIPLIIVFGLELRKKIWVLVGVLYLVLFYLFGAHKTVYVGLVVVLVFYRFSFEQSVKYIVKFSGIAVAVVALFAFLGYDYPWILSFRRVHFLPTLLDICYLDYFSDNYLYWSESILKRFVKYPFDVKHENVIAQAYFNRSDMAANNGLISEGYMNFGSLGVFLNIFLVAGYFMVLNSLRIPAKYFGLFLLVIFSFLSSSVFTVLLTHGGLMLLIVSIFLINEKSVEIAR